MRISFLPIVDPPTVLFRQLKKLFRHVNIRLCVALWQRTCGRDREANQSIPRQIADVLGCRHFEVIVPVNYRTCRWQISSTTERIDSLALFRIYAPSYSTWSRGRVYGRMRPRADIFSNHLPLAHMWLSSNYSASTVCCYDTWCSELDVEWNKEPALFTSSLIKLISFLMITETSRSHPKKTY